MMNIAADLPTITGIIASVLTATSMMPQLIKIVRARKAENVSLVMLGLLVTGLGVWIAYGILRKDYIIIASNSVALLITIITGSLSVYYKAD